MTGTLTVDDLTFQVRRSDRRRTVEIIVERDGALTIAAPPTSSDDEMTDFVREKRFWLYTKLAEKETLRQPTGRREFVSGEGFPYLGRSYRLLIVDDQSADLRLEAGRFRLRRSAVPQGRETFIRWYSDHALPWLTRRVGDWAPRMGVHPQVVEVRDLGFRWGSCGKGGTVNFHWASILLPPSAVDYVIVHELAHLKEPNHTPDFWRRVDRAMPDFEKRKAWLAERGGEHVSV